MLLLPKSAKIAIGMAVEGQANEGNSLKLMQHSKF